MGFILSLAAGVVVIGSDPRASEVLVLEVVNGILKNLCDGAKMEIFEPRRRIESCYGDPEAGSDVDDNNEYHEEDRESL